MKHLKEVPIDSSAGENAIVEFAKKNKYFIIGTAIASAAIAAGIIYVVVKNKKLKLRT